MKKTAVFFALSMLLCLTLLSGCSLKSAPTQEELLAKAAAAAESGDHAAAVEGYLAAEALSPISADDLRAELASLAQLSSDGEQPVRTLAAYEALYAADAFEEADYLALSALYLSAGQNRQARDLLEKGQCLLPSEEKSALLDTITVDISTDSDAVQAALSPIFEGLEADGAAGAVEPMLTLGVDCEALLSRVLGAARRYTSGDGSAVLCAEPGRLSLLRTQSGGQVDEIWTTEALLFVASAQSADGAYSGAFERSVYKAANGSVVSESGTVANGVITGTVTVRLLPGGEPSTLGSLWGGREGFEYAVFTGEIDEAGHATAAQPSSLGEGRIVYAYDAGETQYVFLNVDAAETAETYTFTPASFNLSPLPA